jgi:hypothetical protein
MCGEEPVVEDRVPITVMINEAMAKNPKPPSSAPTDARHRGRPPASSRSGLRFVQRYRPAKLRRHPVHRPCHRHHFARSRLPTASSERSASAAPAPRPRAVCRVQRVLKTNGDVPTIERDCGRRQRLALQPPQPGITIAQHCRRRVGVHPGRGECLSERSGRVGLRRSPLCPAANIDDRYRN